VNGDPGHLRTPPESPNSLRVGPCSVPTFDLAGLVAPSRSCRIAVRACSGNSSACRWRTSSTVGGSGTAASSTGTRGLRCSQSRTIEYPRRIEPRPALCNAGGRRAGRSPSMRAHRAHRADRRQLQRRHPILRGRIGVRPRRRHPCDHERRARCHSRRGRRHARRCACPLLYPRLALGSREPVVPTPSTRSQPTFVTAQR
jgi:hypothetical protein